MATDSDSFTHMTAVNFLGSHATTNEVPVLLKLLKDSDWSSRQAATKALGKLKDERAIQPLADLIARSGSMYGQDASAALINIGAPAERAVIALLNERNADTQRQACNILQQIGTDVSLDPLQKLVGDGDQSTSQAAVEAIRAIKQRQ
jgi:HEAT repeat protein